MHYMTSFVFIALIVQLIALAMLAVALGTRALSDKAQQKWAQFSAISASIKRSRVKKLAPAQHRGR